jgi:hypothetical protein
MKQNDSTIDRVRELMAPANPVPPASGAGSWDDELGRRAYQRIVATTGTGDGELAAAGAGIGGRRSRPAGSPSQRGGRARRFLAPVGAGLAVVGLAVGITVAVGSHSGGRGPGSPAGKHAPLTAGMPPFYVTLSQDADLAIVASVHASRTGQPLTHVVIGTPGSGGLGITAEPSGRDFLIYSGLSRSPGYVATFLLQVSQDGKSARLQRLRLMLVPRGSNDWVEGIAVSPDGKQLAEVLAPGTGTLNVHAEIRVLSLTGGATRTWTAPADPGEAWSPVWTGPGQLTFVWQHNLQGNAAYFYLGKSEVRVLDTSAPGHNFLLGSKVIATETGRLSLIQSVGAGPADSPLDAAVIRVTSIGGSGTETLQLDELSGTKVLTSSSASYSGEAQEGGISARCQILGVAPDGAMLAENGEFGEIVDGTFTPLPHNSGVFAAAW